MFQTWAFVPEENPIRSQPVVGLVGGIASGKSMVAAHLRDAWGAAVLDADQMAHEVLRGPDVVAALRERWGDAICAPRGDGPVGAGDGAREIDRRRLAQIVFAPQADPAELRFLEGLTHPRIRRLAEERLAELARLDDVPAIVIDAPLLVEAGWNGFCDRMIYVESPRRVRLARALARGWSEEDFARREGRQESLEVKRGLADVVIDTSGSLESARGQIDRAWHSLIRPATPA